MKRLPAQDVSGVSDCMISMISMIFVQEQMCEIRVMLCVCYVYVMCMSAPFAAAGNLVVSRYYGHPREIAVWSVQFVWFLFVFCFF